MHYCDTISNCMFVYHPIIPESIIARIIYHIQVIVKDIKYDNLFIYYDYYN